MKRGMLVLILFSIFIVSSIGVYAACNQNQVIFRVYDESNAFGEVWNGTGNYPVEICYNNTFGVSGNGNRICSENNTNKVLGLNATTNAKAEVPSLTTYTTNICYDNLNCTSTTGECSALGTGYEHVVSLSATTNAKLQIPGATENPETYRTVVITSYGRNDATATCPSGYLLAGGGVSCGSVAIFNIIPHKRSLDVACAFQGTAVAKAVCISEELFENVTIVENSSFSDVVTATCPSGYKIIGSGYQCANYYKEGVHLNIAGNKAVVDCESNIAGFTTYAYAICAKMKPGTDINLTQLYKDGSDNEATTGRCPSDTLLVSGGFTCSTGDPQNSFPTATNDSWHAGKCWGERFGYGNAEAYAYCMNITQAPQEYPVKICCKAGVAPSTPELTDAKWNDLSNNVINGAMIGQEVKLVSEGSPNGELINLVIKKKNILGDSIINDSLNAVIANGKASVSWNILGQDNDVLYFLSSLDSNPNIEIQSNELTIGCFCPSGYEPVYDEDGNCISCSGCEEKLCVDYTTEEDCEADKCKTINNEFSDMPGFCGADNYPDPENTNTNCEYRDVKCSCSWDVIDGEEQCNPGTDYDYYCNGNPAGNGVCILDSEVTKNCETGKGMRTIHIVYRWQGTGDPGFCKGETDRQLRCLSTALLDFWNTFNLIVAILIIIMFYIIVVRKKKKISSIRKRKKK